MKGTIHLVRHGEVANPRGVIYGRLPGFHLSERGAAQAQAAADHLAERNISAVVSSPLERARETAEAIAKPHGVDVEIDERLIESGTMLEGMGRTLGAFLRSPGKWWHLRNPWRPSWGESFGDIRGRVMEAIDETLSAAEGEVAFVSHQTPVQAAILALTGRRAPPWSGAAPCVTGSVTTVEMDGSGNVETSYFAPPV